MLECRLSGLSHRITENMIEIHKFLLTAAGKGMDEQSKAKKEKEH